MDLKSLNALEKWDIDMHRYLETEIKFQNLIKLLKSLLSSQKYKEKCGNMKVR